MTLRCNFNAKICFPLRFEWIRSRGFKTQLRESEKKHTVTYGK